MIAQNQFTPDQTALHKLMGEISADLYCAFWMTGVEYDIWDLLQGEKEGRVKASAADVEIFKRALDLSNATAGWITWCDESSTPGLPREQWGPYFVPMATWLEMVASRKASAISA